MSYSSDEIDAEVSSIIQTSPSYNTDGLGGRNVKDRFEQVRELVNSVMMYEPDSVFYLINKAVIRTRYLLSSVLSVMTDISEDLDGMAIPSRDVKDTTALADANNALNTISGALTRRGSISAAEYQKYERAVDRALDVFKESSKRTYLPFSGSTVTTDIVKAYAESAVSLQTNFNTLQTSYETLLQAVDRVLAAYDDYNHDEIVRSVASRQISRIQSELTTIKTSFESKTPRQRTTTVRADVLKLITNKSSVKALSRVRYPEDPKLEQSSTGTSLYRLAAAGTGTPPSITGTVSATWPILSTHELKINLNGSTATVPLVPSLASAVPGIKQATITGSKSAVSGGFVINTDIATPLSLWSTVIAFPGNYAVINTNLYLVVDGTAFTVNFPANGDSAYVAGRINTVAGTHVTASSVTGGGLQKVVIAYSNGSPPDLYVNRYMRIASGASDAAALRNWTVTGVVTADVSEGWDANDELIVWPNDDTSATTVSLTNGTLAAGYIVPIATVVGDIHAVTGISATAASNKIKITSDLYGEGSIIKIGASGLVGGKRSPSSLGADTLGFYKDQEIRESDFNAQALVDVLNSNSSFSDEAVATLVNEEVFSGKDAYGSAANKISIDVADFSGWASWSFSQMKFVIEAGENRGVYGVSAIVGVTVGDVLTLTFTLDRDLRAASEIGMKVRLYSEHLKITSSDSSTSGLIDVDETHLNSAHTILGLSTTLTRGTVNQIQVEYNDPSIGWTAANLTGFSIKVGDQVLQEDGTLVATVTGISSISDGILDITAVNPTLSLTAFSVESVSAKNHSVFIDALREWRDGLTSDNEELLSLTKAINYLLRTNNPPRGRVQTAVTELQTIQNKLEGTSELKDILEEFTVPAIPAVDRALDVMSEQGHDRARDLITSGQFSEYNRTNYKTASISGAMMSAMSDVATSDFVEPTKTRDEFVGEIDKLISSSWDEVDPEHNFRDMRPDAPVTHLDYFLTKKPG